jgi:26S proteasome regulatory subunit N10
MRNGDFAPNRFDAQKESVHLVAGSKTQSNPESNVGLISMAGRNVDVLVTLTQDLGKIMAAIQSVKVGGDSDFVAALQIAQLALKHRQNKRQEQRIVMFVGSPVKATEQELVRLGARMKKNQVAVDIVNFGEEATNKQKLEAFINAVNSSDNSHYIEVPAGPHLLSDVLLSSALVAGEAGVGAAMQGMGGAGGGGFEFGFDPNADPELALAMRLSLEESQRNNAPQGGEQPAADAKPAETQPKPAEAMETDDDDELLQQALAMSRQENKPQETKPQAQPVDAMEDDDEELRLAMQMSQSSQPSGQTQPPQQSGDFMASVLSSLPGVDPNDPNIKGILEAMKKDEKKEDK